MTHCLRYESVRRRRGQSRDRGDWTGHWTRTFDCRVVLVDEVALDELDGQTRFSDTTTTDYYELVLAEELATRVSTRCRDDKTAWSRPTFEAIAAIDVGEGKGGW
jgi:hypothetical protein